MVKKVTKRATSATKRRKVVKTKAKSTAKRSAKKSSKGIFSWF